MQKILQISTIVKTVLNRRQDVGARGSPVGPSLQTTYRKLFQNSFDSRWGTAWGLAKNRQPESETPKTSFVGGLTYGPQKTHLTYQKIFFLKRETPPER